MKVLFVCLGNICRSPIAEVVFAALVQREGLEAQITVDSAGTAGYHAGEAADPRSRECARHHGLAITHRARPVHTDDFARFDYLIAMDADNAAELRRRAPDRAAVRKVHLFRDWDPAGTGIIPDPYYGEASDFEMVWHLCERSAPGLLREIQTKVTS